LIANTEISLEWPNRQQTKHFYGPPAHAPARLKGKTPQTNCFHLIVNRLLYEFAGFRERLRDTDRYHAMADQWRGRVGEPQAV
tara:strand:+ start:21924 stop:22172 length:249 start_codon:yes stop_codon:yes gene_type:complete